MKFKDLQKQYKSITPNPDLESQARDDLMEQFRNNCPDYHTSWVDDLVRFASRCVRPAFVTINAILVIGVITFGLYMSSANAMPGDFLYPMKLSFEKAQMQIVFKESSQNALRAEVLDKRLTEAELLAKRLDSNGLNFNTEFNILAKNFVNELNALEKDIKENMPEKEDTTIGLMSEAEKGSQETQKEPFPEEKLLTGQSDKLPVADGKEIHPFNNANLKEFQKVVSSIRKSLKEKDMQAALNQIEKAQNMVSVNKEDDLKENTLENEKETINEENENNDIELDNKEVQESKDNLDQLKNENKDQEIINDQKKVEPIENTASFENIQKEDESETEADFSIGNNELNSEDDLGIGDIQLQRIEE